jgi:hypothetical protein
MPLRVIAFCVSQKRGQGINKAVKLSRIQKKKRYRQTSLSINMFRLKLHQILHLFCVWGQRKISLQLQKRNKPKAILNNTAIWVVKLLSFAFLCRRK